MCTVSWRISAGGFELFFNRDEQRKRPEAEVPKLWKSEGEGLCFFAPIDPQGGGSWVFVNELGLCAAILNDYGPDTADVPDSRGSFRSRGRLLLDLAASTDSMDCVHRLQSLVTQDCYQPFIVLVLDAKGLCRIRRWNGTDLQVVERPCSPLLTTSSVNAARVEQIRRDAFEQAVTDLAAPDSDGLQTFHRWHDARFPEASVLMSRADARTVSMTRVQFDAGRASMDYFRVTDATPPELEAPVSNEWLKAEDADVFKFSDRE